MLYDIQIISAPSILGLKPSGVERLADSLLCSGLNALASRPVIEVPTRNSLYSIERDLNTKCINAEAIREFSIDLKEKVSNVLGHQLFPLVLGGDCSILLGIMPALKSGGVYGLIFMDAHADFYRPEQSPTGEVADMDLAIVTGRGPDLLTDIDRLKPYVKDLDVIHVGQRDQQETKKYHSEDIGETLIHCIDANAIKTAGAELIVTEVLTRVKARSIDGFWLHFDCDVLADELNPAVDYRLNGGLSFDEAGAILKKLLASKNITGMSVTIFNPSLDVDGKIARQISHMIVDAFK